MRTKCEHCNGCGKIADKDGTPWSAWMHLPMQSALAVIAGLIKPIPCPECHGQRYVDVPDTVGIENRDVRDVVADGILNDPQFQQGH